MELVIKVVIVLGLSVIVGGMILFFVKDALQDARRGIDALDVSDQEYIIEEQVTPTTLNALVKQCYSDRGTRAVETELCFVVHSDINFDPTAIGPFDFGINTNFTSGNNALFIYYNINDSIDITK